jgi:hypothetical protein
VTETTETETAPIEPFTPPTRDPRWAELAAPFPEDEIEWKPQPLGKNLDKGSCNRSHADRNGRWCGGYHELPAIHLAYVGHAGITTRLNEVVTPEGWSWEPRYRHIDPALFKAAIESGDREIVRMLLDNAPPLYTDGGLWINLTILGVTFPGFGDAQGKTGPNAVKEIIGDAIRNGGVRFGIGTYLWGKSAKARALQEASGVVDGAGGQVSPAPDVPHQPDGPEEPIGRGERPRQRPAAPRREQPAPPPPAEDESVEAAGRRGVIRAREAAARERETQGRPAQVSSPAGIHPPRDDGDASALVDEILSCTDSNRFRGPLWALAGQLQPAGRDTDVRWGLSEPAAKLLRLDPAKPIPVGAVVQRAAEHFDRTTVSVRMALRPAPAGQPGDPL